MSEVKKDCVEMAKDWLSDPLLKDLKGGYTEEVVRELVGEVIRLRCAKERNKELLGRALKELNFVFKLI